MQAGLQCVSQEKDAFMLIGCMMIASMLAAATGYPLDTCQANLHANMHQV